MSEQKPGFSDKDTGNIAYALFVGQATCVTIFTRYGFGEEALAKPALAAAAMYVFWILATNSPYLLLGLMFVPFLMLCHRCKRFIDRRHGIVRHSQYCGYPVFTGPLCQDERTARGLEGALIAGGGWWLTTIAGHEGMFLFYSGISIIVLELINWNIDTKRQVALRDAQIEMQWLGESYLGS